MSNLELAGLSLLGLAVVVAVACVAVSRIRARILRNEDAAATEITLAGAIDEDTDMPEPDETEFQEALREARLNYVDPTETFNADAKTRLAAVSHNLVFVDIELGRAYSEIPEATDPWLSDEEMAESTAIALATIETLTNVEALIPERTAVEVLPESYNGFDALREYRRIHAALTDSMVADALIAHDPMMAFLLPVSTDEPLPGFDDALAVWLPEHRIDDGHDIDGNSISWHTGLTQAMRIVRQPALESAQVSR